MCSNSILTLLNALLTNFNIAKIVPFFICIFAIMKITFYKYQGTGNDFILIDNRDLFFDKSNTDNIAKMCHRKFGIGADGLILLENSENNDFKMVYFNADGNESTMCGNGGRCIVHFAHFLGIIDKRCTFEAIDGLHYASIENKQIKLQMIDVPNVFPKSDSVFLDTGSPHHITFNDNIATINVKEKGKKIRYGKPYFTEGTNVNFVQQINNNTFKVRTYERGVEDETLSCGTGVTAVAIAAYETKKTTKTSVILETLGGNLEVSFTPKNNSYTNVFLKGTAIQVFKGIYII